jgi:2,4-dienoyl-CoA reductase-like NADH-dependent reductase (Old Yellow Enzyme family)
MSAGVRQAARPFTLGGGLTLRNRLVGTAHGTAMLADGLVTPGDVEYWRRRAAGGAAMLIVGGSQTALQATWRRPIVTELWRDEAVPGLAAKAEAIRAEGAVAACQLVHTGRETTGAETWYHPVAPSAVRSPREPTRPRALTDGEVDEVVEGFRISAANAVRAGFQVIELHAAHGYLLAQFISAVTNRRPEAGTLPGRLGIISRIVTAIRGRGPGPVIGIRLSAEGGEEAGLSLDGLCEVLPLVSPLVDYVNLTVGVRSTYVRDMATTEPPLLGQIPRLRALVSGPLLISQSFRTEDQIEAALSAGADLVGIARPLIADPDMPRKILAGAQSSIRPCVSCNEDCRTFDPVLLCSVNPELAPAGAARRPARPLVAGRGTGARSGRVAIVGAGPAGLECATALAGHREVVLFDEREAVGGQLAIAAAAPSRAGWRALLKFYQTALEAAADVTLRLGTTADVADLREFDEVVLATGAEEILPELPGIGTALTSSRAIALGAGRLSPGGELLIVDDGFGYWPFASAVELGAQAGFRAITVATPGAAFGAALPPDGRAQLLGRLRGTPLEVRPFSALESLGEGTADLRNTISGRLTRVAAQTVIVVGERRVRDWRPAVPDGVTVQVIGDALVPRRVAHAIAEGRAAAEAITQALCRRSPAADLGQVAGRVGPALAPADLQDEPGDLPALCRPPELVVIAPDQHVDDAGCPLEQLMRRVVNQRPGSVTVNVHVVNAQEVVLHQAARGELVEERDHRIGAVQRLGVPVLGPDVVG